jgi:hypothetical protein
MSPLSLQLGVSRRCGSELDPASPGRVEGGFSGGLGGLFSLGLFDRLVEALGVIQGNRWLAFGPYPVRGRLGAGRGGRRHRIR